MKTAKIIALTMVFVLVCSLLTACGGSDSIVGKWASQEYDGMFVYTFNEDGTGNYDASGTDMPFTYEVDGNKLSITYKGDTVSFDTEYEINGDTLNVKDSNGDDTFYDKK